MIGRLKGCIQNIVRFWTPSVTHQSIKHYVFRPNTLPHPSGHADTPHLLDCRRGQTGSLGRLLPRRVRGRAGRSGLLLLLRLLPAGRRARLLHDRARAVKLAHCLKGALHHPTVSAAPTGSRRRRKRKERGNLASAPGGFGARKLEGADNYFFGGYFRLT